MKILNIELSQVFSPWLKDASTVSCRVSVQSQFRNLNCKQQEKLELQDPERSDNVNIVMMCENTVLGSTSFTLEWLLSRDLNQEFDGWIAVENSMESLSFINSDKTLENFDKSLKIKIKAEMISQEEIVYEEMKTVKEENSKVI